MPHCLFAGTLHDYPPIVKVCLSVCVWLWVFVTSHLACVCVLLGHCSLVCGCCGLQEPMKSRAPQLHLEYRFYKQLGQAGWWPISHTILHIHSALHAPNSSGLSWVSLHCTDWLISVWLISVCMHYRSMVITGTCTAVSVGTCRSTSTMHKHSCVRHLCVHVTLCIHTYCWCLSQYQFLPLWYGY